MALYKDTNLTLYEVKHCVSGTCKANTRQWIHKLKLTCACDHPNITSHIFRHPCHHSRRPRVVRDWNHPIYMGLLPGAHFWGQGGGGGHSPKGILSRVVMWQMRDSLPPLYEKTNMSFQKTFRYHLRKYLRDLSSNARNIGNICTNDDTMICSARKTVNIYNIFSAMLEIL